ncbi:hypothetical protein JCM14719A_20290 [Calditerricola satsumensis]|uniref:Uncharacterized protein n=2 Tax=Calditerricola satsumensis TaxID=373054 RepID=A0A8J3BCG0_9BACI|nr:hypothetical protein GCM10007043_08310 [Calditerricola satsumensis]
MFEMAPGALAAAELAQLLREGLQVVQGCLEALHAHHPSAIGYAATPAAVLVSARGPSRRRAYDKGRDTFSRGAWDMAAFVFLGAFKVNSMSDNASVNIGKQTLIGFDSENTRKAGGSVTNGDFDSVNTPVVAPSVDDISNEILSPDLSTNPEIA